MIAGLMSFLGLTGFIVVDTMAEITFGRPSSTVGLGFFMAPIAGFVVGLAVWVVTKIIAVLMKRASQPSLPIPAWLNRTAWLLTIASLPFNFLASRSNVLAREVARSPRVIVSSPLIAPIANATTAIEQRVEAPELYGGITNTVDAHPIQWNGRLIKVNGVNEQIVVTDNFAAPIVSTDLHDYDYINRIRATPVCTQPDGTSLLAVLVTLRATSHRSMLLVYRADGQLVYQHHLERAGGPKPDTLYAGRRDGVETFVADNSGLVTGWTCAAAR